MIKAVILALFAGAIAAGITAHDSKAHTATPYWELISGTNETPAEYAADKPCLVGIFGHNNETKVWSMWFVREPVWASNLTWLDQELGYFVSYNPGCLFD